MVCAVPIKDNVVAVGVNSNAGSADNSENWSTFIPLSNVASSIMLLMVFAMEFLSIFCALHAAVATLSKMSFSVKY